MKILKKFTIATLALVFMFGFLGLVSVNAAGPDIIDLGTAGNFTILSKSGISTTGTTSVIGDIGVSPAEATYITGFGLILPSSSAFATSSLVTGKVYTPSYAAPTPENIRTAISDMETAYTDGAGRTNPTATELGAGNIGGLTIAPGLYKWGTGVIIPADVTLSGGANDVWIFQIAQNLDISSATKVILSGGAKANNIFWVVAGQTTIGTTAVFNGNILDQTAIILNTGAIFNGRALAQTAVTLDSNSVIIPSGSFTKPTQNINPTPNTNTNTNTNTNLNLNNSSSNNSSVNSVVLLPNNSINNGRTNNNIILPNASIFGQTISAMAGSLKAGSMGNFVKTLQEFLISQDTANIALKNYGPDGKFGPVTKAALIKWQNAHNLVGDGILGAKTKAKIKDLGL